MNKTKTTIFHASRGMISYVVQDVSTNRAIVIDPSMEELERILIFIKQNKLEVPYVLDTHTHADYFSSRALVKNLYGSKIGMSTLSPTQTKDLYLKDGDVINVDAINLRVIETPGHTNESLTFAAEEEIFTGDTLLISGTGRTDFQLGDSADLYNSLGRLLDFSDETIVYPGHNYKGISHSTLAQEKEHNERLKLVVEGAQKDFVELLDAHQPSKPDLFEESLAFNAK